jgi:hypothetical protein
MPTTRAIAAQARYAGKSGPALKRYLGGTVRTADRIDYWIRRQVIDTPLAPVRNVASELSPDAQTTAPVASPAQASARRRTRASPADGPRPSKLMLACDRRVWLSALGRALKAEYDALAAPLPPRLAALVQKLEAQS